VAYTGLLIRKSTPLRVGLRLEKETDAAWRAGRAPLAALDVNVLSERHARAALVLALPMAVTLWRYAGTGPWWAALWILIGVAVAMGVRWMSGVIADREPAVIRKWIDATHEERPPASGLWAAYELCPKDLEDRDTLRPSYRRLHWRASMFALTASGLGLRSPIES
jgi:hypothetical protein